jgi:DnaJ-class molecular chaperone
MGKHGKKQTCKRCNGSGTIVVDADGKDGRSQETRSCPGCGGTGEV